jgi:hypothetical protein
MTREEIAAEYLAVPNALLTALGGDGYLRKEVGASQFKVLHSWPSSADRLPFGLSFRFRVREQDYSASICTAISDHERYSLDIFSRRYGRCDVSESSLLLAQVVTKFFEFATADLVG